MRIIITHTYIRTSSEVIQAYRRLYLWLSYGTACLAHNIECKISSALALAVNDSHSTATPDKVRDKLTGKATTAGGHMSHDGM